MNYVILNGAKSTDIKGLLIQSLPPISKPLMRTSIEEIDGRDGDIVTKLGYSAYDKEMLIGLFGDYDTDDVIQFFDSEGVVTFSNEPDKFYKYQIIDQIDFEKLIRFRQATVKFHVQPFKYSAVDDSYTYEGNETEFTIMNRGNTVARPRITVYGSGIVNLGINGTAVCVINIGANEYITIDAAQMNAYKGDTLMNRSVVGDYDNLVLRIGSNTISWTGTGTVTKVEIENFARWI